MSDANRLNGRPQNAPPTSHVSGLRHDVDDYETRVNRDLDAQKRRQEAQEGRGRKLVVFLVITMGALIVAALSAQIGGA